MSQDDVKGWFGCVFVYFYVILPFPIVVLPLRIWRRLLRAFLGSSEGKVGVIILVLIWGMAAVYLHLDHSYVIKSQHLRHELRLDVFHAWELAFIDHNIVTVFLLWIAELFVGFGFVLSPLYIIWILYRWGYFTRSKTPKLGNETLRSKHRLVLGATGSGKTTTVLEPSIKGDIDNGYGLIFMTAKEEQDFLSRVLAYVIDAGRAQDLRIFSISDSFPSHSYNPLSYGDATSLRDMIFEAFTWDSPYYRDQAKSALLHVLEALVETGKAFALRDLYYVFSNKSAMEKVAADCKDEETRFHLMRYLDEWKTFHENTRGLIANLEDYAGKALVNRLAAANPEINLIDAYNTNKIVIIVLNSLQYGETAKCLGRMILQNLRYMSGLIAAGGENKKFFPCYIDEFHHFVYPQFFSMVAQCRSSNIGLTLSTQSFADMKTEDWDITTQIVQNTNTKIILRQNDADSAELVAKLAGTETATHSTEQYEHGLILGKTYTGRGSERQVEQFVIHPNIIKRLGLGEAAVIVEGHAEVCQFKRPKPPKRFYDWGEWFESVIPPHDHEPRQELDVFGILRQEEQERRQKGIIRKVKNEKELPPSGLGALKADLENNL